MTIDWLPVVLSLTSAFLFAVGAQFQHIGLLDVPSRAGTAITITSSAFFYWLFSPFLLDPSNFLKSAAIIFVLVGVFRPSLSANFSVAATRYLGPTLSSTLSSTSPLFGAALGVWWLGEVFTWQIAVGTMGIIVAVVILSLGKARDLKADWPLWALALPIGAAMIRSVAHVFSKIGMIDIPDPYFAGLVGFTVSALITTSSLRFGPKMPAVSWKTNGPRWFAAAGLMFGSAIMSLNTALLHGTITVVVPITALAPIFSMLLSIFIFKRERLTARIVLAVLIVVPSVIFITLSQS